MSKPTGEGQSNVSGPMFGAEAAETTSSRGPLRAPDIQPLRMHYYYGEPLPRTGDSPGGWLKRLMGHLSLSRAGTTEPPSDLPPTRIMY